MAKVRPVESSTASNRKMRPALTPEARENQLIAMAVDLAEKQLREGTASSQVIAHYLKQSTAKTKLENERLQEENKLLRAKTKAIENAEANARAYEEVIKVLREYNGQGDDDEYYDY